ncbi:MAG: hypothetical protein ACXWUG_07745 [Polyangiales bacterium]
MGRERDCKATIEGKTIEGRALLETDEVIFRSKGAPLRLKFASLKKVEAKNGKLELDDVVLALGDDAPKWAEAIKNPKGRIQKLGVKAGQKIVALAIDDESFLAELRAVTPEASTTLKGDDLDLVFYGASTKKSLDRLAALKTRIAAAGAIWIVRPKGIAAITEADVRLAAQAVDLVDVKVVKFSETHTAEKLVIPVVKRR